MVAVHNLIKLLIKKLDEVSLNMEKLKLEEYIYYIKNPHKMLFANFLGGIARGFGIAVGFTLLGALVIFFLRQAVMWNIPLIGKFISEIVKIVNENMKNISP